MKKLALVALGGTVGSLTRYLITESITRYSIAIFIVNILGVAVAGLFAYRMTVTQASQLFWIPGFAGGFTTFSSVAVIYNNQAPLTSVIYFFGTVICSLLVLAVLSPKKVS